MKYFQGLTHVLTNDKSLGFFTGRDPYEGRAPPPADYAWEQSRRGGAWPPASRTRGAPQPQPLMGKTSNYFL